LYAYHQKLNETVQQISLTRRGKIETELENGNNSDADIDKNRGFSNDNMIKIDSDVQFNGVNKSEKERDQKKQKGNKGKKRENVPELKKGNKNEEIVLDDKNEITYGRKKEFPVDKVVDEQHNINNGKNGKKEDGNLQIQKGIRTGKRTSTNEKNIGHRK